MASGRYIDLANVTFEDINLEDINTALNTIYRFTGHWKDKKPLTLAQHTRLVMYFGEKLSPDDLAVQLDCLLHDMPEAYYGDMATPWKKILGEVLRNLQEEIDEKVYGKLWLIKEPFTEDVENIRKICDRLSLDIERRNMWKDQKGKDLWPEVPNHFSLSLKEKEELFDWVQSEPFDLIKAYDNIVK